MMVLWRTSLTMALAGLLALAPQAAHAQGKPPMRPLKAPKAPPKNGKGAGNAGRSSHGAKPVQNTPVSSPSGRPLDEPDSPVLTQAERDYFQGRFSSRTQAWAETTRVSVSGLPQGPSSSPGESAPDTSWLSRLDLPDLPLRWDARVVHYLEFFKDDTRGKAMLATFAKRSGRYGEAIRRTLRKKGLPEDLAWLAMIESGYDPVVHSRAGAAGLWQFMPDTGRQYGLTQDRFVDQRYSPRAATEAAADYLADLHRRFGSWELAMAAYDMGHGGISGVVKRYNTNDYWALSQLEGSLPWETTLYVPKILAVAVAMRNPGVFSLRNVSPDASLDGDDVAVPSGVALSAIAQASGVSVREIEQLNPELRLGMTPQSSPTYTVRVPQGRGASVQNAFAKELATRAAEASKTGAPESDRTPTVVVPQEAFVYPDRRRVFHRVQGGDTLRDVAERYSVSSDEIVKWNQVDPAAKLLDGMSLQLFVPMEIEPAKLGALLDTEVRVVAVGSEDFIALFELRGRKRVVVKAKTGDTLQSIADAHHVSPGLLERINRKARSERLSEGADVVMYVGESGTPSAAIATHAPAGKKGVHVSPAPSPAKPQALPGLPQ